MEHVLNIAGEGLHPACVWIWLLLIAASCCSGWELQYLGDWNDFLTHGFRLVQCHLWGLKQCIVTSVWVSFRKVKTFLIAVWPLDCHKFKKCSEYLPRIRKQQMTWIKNPSGKSTATKLFWENLEPHIVSFP